MKLEYLITHLRISDTQCNGATHTHQQRKNSKPHHQTEKSWQHSSGTGRGHSSSIFCLEETPSLLLFSKLKESLVGKTFSDDDEVQDAVMTWLREQAEDLYDAGIRKLVLRLTKCIAIHGDYAEK
jgi:hypothetical protein